MKLFGTKDIKVFIQALLKSRSGELKNKIVLDIPAGSGFSSGILKDIEAKVEAFDLFPEFFNVVGLDCKFADLSKVLPIESNYADFILCQEGVEHLANQHLMFAEFNRVLKMNGILFLTTPNASNLRSRISHLLSESEYSYKKMPPNEVDSIWFSDSDKNKSIYFGHIFLIGIQKLRVLASLNGFRIKKTHHFRINHTSLLLMLFCYPFILLVNLLGYLKAVNNITSVNHEEVKKVYLEQLLLGIDPRILVGGHIIVEFQKINDATKMNFSLYNKYKDCNIVT